MSTSTSTSISQFLAARVSGLQGLQVGSGQGDRISGVLDQRPDLAVGVVVGVAVGDARSSGTARSVTPRTAHAESAIDPRAKRASATARLRLGFVRPVQRRPGLALARWSLGFLLCVGDWTTGARPTHSGWPPRGHDLATVTDNWRDVFWLLRRGSSPDLARRM